MGNLYLRAQGEEIWERRVSAYHSLIPWSCLEELEEVFFLNLFDQEMKRNLGKTAIYLNNSHSCTVITRGPFRPLCNFTLETPVPFKSISNTIFAKYLMNQAFSNGELSYHIRGASYRACGVKVA